jgi:hydrogenase nickel incorporation protein HypA/HybF
MHEMGIAESILEAVWKETALRPGFRVQKIGLRLGDLSGVDTESLSFCFDALVRDTDLDPLELAIEFVQGDALDLTYLELEEEGPPGVSHGQPSLVVKESSQ